MDEETNKKRNGTGGETGQHLTVDELNALLDGALDPVERQRAEAHLRSCGRCRTELEELRSTVMLLQRLPEHRPKRSFQLSPEHARVKRSGWSAWVERLMPSLPAMRTATIAIALILVAVSAGDLLRDRGSGGGSGGNPVLMSQPTATQKEAPPQETAPQPFGAAGGESAREQTAVPTSSGGSELNESGGASGGSGSGESAGAALAPQSDTSASTETAEPKPAAAANQSESTSEPKGVLGVESVETPTEAPVMMNAAAKEAASPLPATPTATVLPATPEATAALNAPAAPSERSAGSTSGGGTSTWRLAEIGLAILLALMLVAVFLTQRARARI